MMILIIFNFIKYSFKKIFTLKKPIKPPLMAIGQRMRKYNKL